MKLPAAAAIVFTISSVYAQISVLTGALANVSTSVRDVDDATTNFNMDAVKASADTLLSAIAAGKDAVIASRTITLTDSLGLNGPVQQQNKDFETLAADLRTRRAEIAEANACSDVRSSIAGINTASLGLIEAIIGKVPQAARPIVRQVATGTTRMLNEAQNDFSEDNCKDASPTSTAAHTSSPTASEGPEAADADSKPAPVGGIVGGVLGGVGAIAAIGLCVFVWRRRRQQGLKQEAEAENAVELDSSDPRAPLSSDYKESTAIHEAPETTRYELE